MHTIGITYSDSQNRIIVYTFLRKKKIIWRRIGNSELMRSLFSAFIYFNNIIKSQDRTFISYAYFVTPIQ